MQLRSTQSRYAPRRGQVATPVPVPAPIAGLNAVSSIADMAPTDAVVLDNWFPQKGALELRHGWQIHSTDVTDPFETLMTYSDSDGTETLFGVAGDTIYNATVAGAPVASSVTTLASARCQYVGITNAFDNFLIVVNGADTPKKYNGTAWSDAVYTAATGSPSLTAANLIHVITHHRRLWFVEKNTTNAWFGNIDEVQGELTFFDFGELFPRGGYLMALGSWSVDSGEGMNDLLVGISSEGDVAVYQGIDPNAIDFVLVGRFFVGKPLGRRCMARYLADLLILTAEGAVPMSSVLAQRDQPTRSAALTDRIQALLSEDATTYRSEFGWEIRYVPEYNQLYINVPDTRGQRQYVMNTITHAWCRFIGYEALCFTIFANKPFFGHEAGIAQAYSGHLDEYSTALLSGEQISARCVQAFQYFGSNAQKHFRMARPVFLTENSPTVQMNIAVDFEYDADDLALPAISGDNLLAIWDTAIWDADLWSGGLTTIKRWYGTSPIGFCGAPALVISNNARTFWPSTDVMFETGGML
jgi:hypothetical protein